MKHTVCRACGSPDVKDPRARHIPRKPNVSLNIRRHLAAVRARVHAHLNTNFRGRNEREYRHLKKYSYGTYQQYNNSTTLRYVHYTLNTRTCTASQVVNSNYLI